MEQIAMSTFSIASTVHVFMSYIHDFSNTSDIQGNITSNLGENVTELCMCAKKLWPSDLCHKVASVQKWKEAALELSSVLSVIKTTNKVFMKIKSKIAEPYFPSLIKVAVLIA